MVLKCKTTPFQYYFDIVSNMLSSDRSYDALPNFTATDCMYSAHPECPPALDTSKPMQTL